MSSNEILRRFCEAESCPVWTAIKDAEKRESAVQRHSLVTNLAATTQTIPLDNEPRSVLSLAASLRGGMCAERCFAHRYHVFLKRSNMSIIPNEGKDRYVGG